MSIMEMLAYKRPHLSETEQEFIGQFIGPLGVQQDAIGNLYKRIGTDPILWSCHTDTVHKRQGKQKLKRTNEWVGSESNCLGADDTAGVWLMVEMIKAGKEGLYIFHRGEESGCIGSKYIARTHPELLQGMKAAIALDRRGTTSVITHQMGRSCSDDFAKSLAAQLGEGFKPDDTGIYTDTVSYVDHIGECTNLSVGYEGAHTYKEVLNLKFLYSMKEKLLALNTSALTYSRQPGEEDPDDYSGYGRYFGGNYGGYKTATATDARDWISKQYGSYYDNYNSPNLTNLIRQNPATVASILEDYGFNYSELYEMVIEKQKGWNSL